MHAKMFFGNSPARKIRARTAASLLFGSVLLLGHAQTVTTNAHENGNAWRIVITSQEEPGEPMRVTGALYASDRKTPVPGVEIYVYHTDAEGYYRKGSTSSSNPRLKGVMITNAEGRYEYRTIKPAPYPGGNIPAHVHYVITAKGKDKQYAELQFEGDRWLRDRGQLTEEQRRDTFADVRPLMKDEHGVWQVRKDLTIK